MSSNSRNRKKMSKKAIMAILFIGIIVGGSSLGIALTQMASPQPFLDKQQINNVNVTKYVAYVMKDVPLDCYSYYPGGNKTIQPEIRVYVSMTEKFYNVTHLDSRTLTTNAPYQAYLFSHCSFIDVSKNPLPIKFNPALVSNKTLAVPQELMRKTIESQQLTNYNFTYVALQTPTIEDIGNKFAMTYSEVVDQLAFHKLYNQTKDCINPSWRSNSGLLDCTFHRSQFIIDLNSSRIIATLILPKNNTKTL